MKNVKGMKTIIKKSKEMIKIKNKKALKLSLMIVQSDCAKL
jgi:hypothetical protein